jgi:HAE1 family hydrophobic/amphiphilic exporter-1
MKLVDTAIKRPVTVIVGAILMVLFGFISLYRIPIQLTPNVDLPEVSVETRWEGASPQEVEREIIDVQEEELKNLEGLDSMESESRDGYAYINLMFEIGTDPDDALLRVSKKLDQVKKYPTDADKPLIKSGGRREQAIAWMVLKARDGYQGVLNQEFDFIDDQVKPFLERIDNIASVNVYGGQERELTVTIDTEAMAARKITIPELLRALAVENRNVSAGSFDEGKRKYVTRTVGEFRDVTDVENVIIKRVNRIPVKIGDIARVQIGFEELDVVVRHEGSPTIVMNVVREPGSNVLVIMSRLKEVLKDIN